MPTKFASVTEQRAELLTLYREGIIDSSLLRESLASLVRETVEPPPAVPVAPPPPPAAPEAPKSRGSKKNAKKRARAKKKTAAQAPEPKEEPEERVLQAAQIPAEEPLSDEEVAEMLGLNEDDDEPPSAEVPLARYYAAFHIKHEHQQHPTNHMTGWAKLSSAQVKRFREGFASGPEPSIDDPIALEFATVFGFATKLENHSSQHAWLVLD